MSDSHSMMFRPPQFDWLSRVPISATRDYPRGAIILEERDGPRTAILLVLRGVVRLSIQWPDGREHVILFLPAGSMFGEQAALGMPIETSFTATADTDCSIGEMVVADILAAAREDPSIFRDIMRMTSAKTTHFLREFSRSVFGTALMQVASVLSTLSVNSNIVSVSQERLATITGKTRMTVSSQLHFLAQIGAIRLERSRIVVIDAPLLARHAGGAASPGETPGTGRPP